MNKYIINLTSTQTVYSKAIEIVEAKTEEEAKQIALERAKEGWARWHVDHVEDYTFDIYDIQLEKGLK